VADRKHGIPAPSTTWSDLRGSELSSFDPQTVGLKGAIIDPAQALVIAATLGLVVLAD
jgi:fluoroquinolone resistance protein